MSLDVNAKQKVSYDQFQPSISELDQSHPQSSSSNELSPSSFNSNVSLNHSALANSASFQFGVSLNGPNENQSLSQPSNLQGSQQKQVNTDLLNELSKKGDKCSELFLDAMNSDNTPRHIQRVLTALDNVYGQGSISRHGETLDKSTFTRAMFHTALLSGAHIVVNDGGALTADLLQKGGKTDNSWSAYAKNGGKQAYDGKFYDRSGRFGSSHYGGKDGQWGADLGHALQDKGFAYKDNKWMGHLLIGTTSDGDSFFQFENNGTSNMSDRFGFHTGDTINHGCSGFLQIGPQGKIQATEKGKEPSNFVVKNANSSINNNSVMSSNANSSINNNNSVLSSNANSSINNNNSVLSSNANSSVNNNNNNNNNHLDDDLDGLQLD